MNFYLVKIFYILLKFIVFELVIFVVRLFDFVKFFWWSFNLKKRNKDVKIIDINRFIFFIRGKIFKGLFISMSLK